MTDPMVIAAAAVLVITALSGAAVAVIAALGKMKTEVLGRVAAVAGQATEIHNKVNGTAMDMAAKMHRMEQQVLVLTEKWAKAEGELKGLVSPVPGAGTEVMVAKLAALIKEHDTWEREREAQLLAAHDVGVAAGTAAGIEQERSRAPGSPKKEG